MVDCRSQIRRGRSGPRRRSGRSSRHRNARAREVVSLDYVWFSQMCLSRCVSFSFDTRYAVAATILFQPAAANSFHLYFVFSLCERKNEIQKEDKVPLRISTFEQYKVLLLI